MKYRKKYKKLLTYAHNMRIIIIRKEVMLLKSKDLIGSLTKNGFELHRHGSNHDIYRKGNITIAVPRHKEINEDTARDILKEAGLK